MALRAKFSKKTLLALLLMLSLMVAMLGPGAGQALRGPVMTVEGWLGDGGMYLVTATKAKVHEWSAEPIAPDEARRLKARNEALQAQVCALSAQWADHLEQIRKIQQLRSLAFGPTDDLPCELIPARVVAGDSQAYGQTRVLSARGARPGLPVTTRELLTDRSKALAPNGLSAIHLPPDLAKVSSAVLVGRVLESTAFSARLQLVTDRGFARFQARIQRRIAPDHPDPTRRALSNDNIALIGVEAGGDGKGGLTVSGVKESDRVRVGDWLVTRSDEALLPAQVAIGEVTEVKGDPRQPGFVNLRVRPLADLEALREVYVVVPRGKSEFSNK